MTRKAFDMLPKLMVVFLATCVAMADNGSLAVDNPTDVEITACMQYVDLGTGSMECHVISPNNMTMLHPKADKVVLSLADNSAKDISGRPMNCSSAEYPQGSCTLVEFVGKCVSIDPQNGYNGPVKVACLCSGSASSSISCDIPQSKWPEELKIRDESGLPIACRGGTGLLSCQDAATSPGSDFPLSVSICCTCENAVIKVTRGSLK